MKKSFSFCVLLTIIELVQCIIIFKNSQDNRLDLKSIQDQQGELQQLTHSQRLSIGEYSWFNALKENPVLTEIDKEKCESNNDCLNEGICYEKACYCKTYFVGPICQYELSKPIELNNVVFYIILICALIAGVFVMVLINQIIRKKQVARLKREGEYNDKYEIWTSML